MGLLIWHSLVCLFTLHRVNRSSLRVFSSIHFCSTFTKISIQSQFSSNFIFKSVFSENPRLWHLILFAKKKRQWLSQWEQRYTTKVPDWIYFKYLNLSSPKHFRWKISFFTICFSYCPLKAVTIVWPRIAGNNQEVVGSNHFLSHFPW